MQALQLQDTNINYHLMAILAKPIQIGVAAS